MYIKLQFLSSETRPGVPGYPGTVGTIHSQVACQHDVSRCRAILAHVRQVLFSLDILRGAV